MGFHKKIVVDRKRLPRRYVLYREYIANYSKDMGRIFKELNSDLRDVFRGNLSFGIYYDNPQIVVDQSKCRASVGIYLDPSDINKAQGFATVHKQYRFKELPEMDCIYTDFPYKNSLSILWAVLRIFPKLINYLVQNNLVQDYCNEVDGIVENYYWNGPNKYTEFAIPFGKTIKQFSLTTFPQPTLQPQFQNKSE